jgi:hypothetical protein
MPAQAINDYVVGGVKKFLDALNSSGGTPMERLSPRDARQVLIDAQNSVTGRSVWGRHLGKDHRFRGKGFEASHCKAHRGKAHPG